MDLLSSCAHSILKRMRLLAVLNALYFSSILVVTSLTSLFLAPPLYQSSSPTFPVIFSRENLPVMILGIFLFNLIFSAFIAITLPGLIFFPSSVLLLEFRAVLWGLLIHPLPAWNVLAALPTLVLEGEAYVFAALSGTALGVAWLRPAWVSQKTGISRVDTLKQALSESKYLYFVVVLLLLAGAVVEALTLASL